MFWKHSRKDTALLLNATLVLASAYAFVILQAWNDGYPSQHMEEMTANSVGIYAEVEENEVNGLVAQLDAWEEELTAREATLLRAEQTNERYPLLLITVVGFGLLGLILLNFYLDTKRRVSLAG